MRPFRERSILDSDFYFDPLILRTFKRRPDFLDPLAVDAEVGIADS